MKRLYKVLLSKVDSYTIVDEKYFYDEYDRLLIMCSHLNNFYGNTETEIKEVRVNDVRGALIMDKLTETLSFSDKELHIVETLLKDAGINVSCETK